MTRGNDQTRETLDGNHDLVDYTASILIPIPKHGLRALLGGLVCPFLFVLEVELVSDSLCGGKERKQSTS